MTIEEAITNLNMISVAFVEPVTMEQRKLIDDTFEMAISALNSLEEVYAKGYNDGFMQAEVNYENDKALSQESKTGHWIEHPEIKTSAPEYLMFYECSECGDKQCFCKSDIHKKHFCNNCGARMVEPQESEDKTE